MVSLAGVVGFVQEFDCITSDIDANKHIPVDGMLCGVEVENGDILYNMQNGDSYKYDKENKKWLLQ